MRNTDLVAWWCHSDSGIYIQGITYVGTACDTSKGQHASLNEIKDTIMVLRLKRNCFI